MKSKIVFVALFSLFLALSSCVTYKRCADKFSWKSDTTINVTYKDTVIVFSIKGSAPVFASAPIGSLVSAHSGTAHATAKVVHDTIRLEVSSSDSTYRVKLDSALKETVILNKQLAVKTEEGRGAKFLNKLFGCLLVIAVIALIIVVIPRIIKKK